jgi:hypothetical protein
MSNPADPQDRLYRLVKWVLIFFVMLIVLSWVASRVMLRSTGTG